MIYMENECGEGAHFNILKCLIDTNMDQEPCGGGDRFTVEAAAKIRSWVGADDADVEFFYSAAQANAVAVDALAVKGRKAVAAYKPAGIGFSVDIMPSSDGKLNPLELVRSIPEKGVPGIVCISHPTSCGALYTAEELSSLRLVCDRLRIPLYLDGSRLAYALACEGGNVTIQTIAAICDAFSVGGTEVGALCGAAVVFTKGRPDGLDTAVVSKGAATDKGRLVGVQFCELFSNDLYQTLAKRAVDMAENLRRTLSEKGYEFRCISQDNSMCVIMDNEKAAEIKKKVRCRDCGAVSDYAVAVGFTVGWATRREDIDSLTALL